MHGMQTSSLPLDADPQHEASADQREMVRLVRLARTEVGKRLREIGCMNPEEIETTLVCLDKLIDLHVYVHSMDERLESTRERLNRTTWND